MRHKFQGQEAEAGKQKLGDGLALQRWHVHRLCFKVFRVSIFQVNSTLLMIGLSKSLSIIYNRINYAANYPLNVRNDS